MESKGRRTEIQIETHEVKVVRFRNTQALALCERCGEILMALMPEQTAEVLDATQDDRHAETLSTSLQIRRKK